MQLQLRKTLLGLLYTWGLELMFSTIGSLCIAAIWYAAFHFTGLADKQSTYIYHPYELKYFVIVVGGIRRRIAVKKFYQKRILGQ